MSTFEAVIGSNVSKEIQEIVHNCQSYSGRAKLEERLEKGKE